MKTKVNESEEKDEYSDDEGEIHVITKVLCLLFSEVQVPPGRMEVHQRGMFEDGLCVQWQGRLWRRK